MIDMRIAGSIFVMKTLQIRNVPDDLHRVLHSRAAASGMSLSDYLLREVSRVAARPPAADVLRGAAARSGGAPSDAILETVREARARS